MSKKIFRGQAGKNIWENDTFARGVQYTNDPLEKGNIKAISNLDTSRTGNGLRPRNPMYNIPFKFEADDFPISLGNDTYPFRPIQDDEKRYLLSIGGKRKSKKHIIIDGSTEVVHQHAGAIDEDKIRVIDADTIEFGGTRYRLLGIDAREYVAPDPVWNYIGTSGTEEEVFNIDRGNEETTNTCLTIEQVQSNLTHYRDPANYNEDLVMKVNHNRTQCDNGICGPESCTTYYFKRGYESMEHSLTDLLNQATEIALVYDDANDGDIDAFSRHLVWVYILQGTTWINVNLHMLQDTNTYEEVKAFGAYDEKLSKLHIPLYKGNSSFPIETSTINSIYQTGAVTNNKPIDIHEVGNSVVIYEHDQQINLKAYEEEGFVKTPYIELTSPVGILNTSKVNEDLELSYGIPITVELNNQSFTANEESYKYSTEYKPWTLLKDLDALVFMGKIKKGNTDEVLYEGIISLKYFIPLEDNTPLFENAEFQLETYKNNVFKVKFEELNNRYNLNLLDPNIPGRQDFIGDDAEENNYFTYLIPTIGVLNENNKFVSQLAQGRNYTVRPFYVLPEMHNLETHHGYAVKWDFFTNDNYFKNKIFQAYPQLSHFPDTGNPNVIYVDTSNDNQHYRWDGNSYVTDDTPTPVESTGWRLTFDKQGQHILLSDYYTYTRFEPILEGEPTKIESLGTVKVVSNYEYNDQKKMNIDFERVAIPEGFTSSDSIVIYNSDVIKTSLKSIKFFLEVDEYNHASIISAPIEVYLSENPGGPTETRHLRAAFYSNDDGTGYLGSVPLSEFGYTSNNLQEWTINVNNNVVQAIPNIETTQSIRILDIAHNDQGPIQPIGYYQIYKSSLLRGDSVENPNSNFDGYEFPENISENNDLKTIKTTDPIFQRAKALSQGEVYCRVHLSKVTIEDGEHVESDLEMDVMSRIQSLVVRIRSQEELEVQYQHGQDLHKCRGITSFKGQLILYDSPKSPTVIYLSDEGGNITYFPFRRALDQFNSKVLHVEPVKEGIIVFTTDDIYMVIPMEDENGQIVYVAEVIYSNLSIQSFNRNTVRATGNDIVFMADKHVMLLRPNPYVNEPTAYFLEEASKPIQDLLQNPLPYIIRRLMYYGTTSNTFTESWETTIEPYLSVRNEEIRLYLSATVNNEDPITLILVLDRSNRTWRFYDTRAAALPYVERMYQPEQGVLTLMRNRGNVSNSTTLMLNKSLNLWDFAEADGRLFDIKGIQYDTEEEVFVFNQVETADVDNIKQPIQCYINTGYMAIENHLNKRFHKAYITLQNIDVQEIPFAMEFQIDGKIRQTSNQIRMKQITDMTDPNYGQVYEDHQFEPFIVSSNQYIEGGMNLSTWQLGMHRFGPANKLRIEIGLSGRGRNPHLEFGISTKGRFEIFNYGIIFKEQSSN